MEINSGHALKIETEWPIAEYFKEMNEVFHTDGCMRHDRRKVFVTGCFDMLHSGHVAFLKEAASYGRLYVGIGSDANVIPLKADIL